MRHEPRCCPLSEQPWPLSVQVPNTHLCCRRLAVDRLDTEDFARWGIPQPRGVNKRQAEFLAGRFCAQEALHQLTGTRSTPSAGADRAPIWPAEVTGSISHGAGYVAAVVAAKSHWQSLGLDIEQCLPSSRAQALASNILTPHEQNLWQHLSLDQQAQRIGLSFSLKESLFKALYPLTQRRFYFHDAECHLLPEQGLAQLCLRTDLSVHWPAGRKILAHYGLLDGHWVTLVGIPPTEHSG